MKGAEREIDGSQKVWVGGLPNGITQEDLVNAFGQVGSVISASTMKGNSACVAFSSAEEAQLAIQTLDGGELAGATLKVDSWTKSSKGGGKGGGKHFQPQFQPTFQAASPKPWANNGGGFGGGGFQNSMGGKGQGKLRDIDAAKKIWVGRLPDGVTEEELITAFGQAGTVLMAVPMKGNTAGIAYDNADSAQVAIQTFNGGEMNGSILEVDSWERKPGKGKGGGGKQQGGFSFQTQNGSFGKAMGNSSIRLAGVGGFGNAWGNKGGFNATPYQNNNGQGQGKGKGKGGKFHPEMKIPGTQKVWVGSLPGGVTEDDLKQVFGQVGTVLSASAMKGNTACVAFSSPEEAMLAIQTLNGGELGDSIIQVDSWSKSA